MTDSARKPVFMALGDLHLSDFIWTKYRQIAGDAVFAFQSLFNASKALGVPVVLVGDIFDVNDPQPALVQIFRSTVEAYPYPVYAIQGNHDKRPTPWYSAITDKVIHLGDGVPHQLGNLTVAGLDFGSKEQITAAVRELPALDVLFLHQAVRQKIPWDGAWNFDLIHVPHHVQKVIMGDIHDPWTYDMEDGRQAYYTGSSHPRSWGEVGQKYALLVYDDLSTERIPLPGRPMRKFVIQSVSDFSQIDAWVASLRSASTPPPLPPVIGVVHRPELTPEVVQLQVQYKDCFVISEVAITESEMQLEVDLGPAIQLTPRSFLKAFIPEDDPAHAFAAALLEPGADVPAIINSHRVEALA